ncbi:deubiquitinase OTUD6B [Brevipalpus obovatus]|uniref:deubiquitinase OTUD6B n=1 Tax=Brevipalpus obovatus TaxID=246614 RepID=UPI003D9EBD54
MEEEEDSVAVRQRQERKELQAKITTMKKSIPKNDKKRKKEIMDEINRLELEMKNRHQAESSNQAESIDLSKLSEDAQTANDSSRLPRIEDLQIEDQEGNPRISKAQRKRDRKAQQEKDKRERIETESRELEATSDRTIEEQLMKDILNRNGLKIVDIPSDGDCLFRAIQHQLSLTSKSTSVAELRKKCADELRKRKNEFLPFLINPDSDEVMNERDFKKYCDQMEKTKCWGGNVELQALSYALKLPIKVIQAFGSSVEIGVDRYKSAQPLLISYHRHAFQLGEHYNSVIEA